MIPTSMMSRSQARSSLSQNKSQPPRSSKSIPLLSQRPKRRERGDLNKRKAMLMLLLKARKVTNQRRQMWQSQRGAPACLPFLKPLQLLSKNHYQIFLVAQMPTQPSFKKSLMMGSPCSSHRMTTVGSMVRKTKMT